MTDFRKLLDEGGCRQNEGCHPHTCVCALAGDMADEIDQLRVNLGGSIAALKMCNDQIEQLHEQLDEATAEVEKLRELWENSPGAAHRYT